MEIIAECQTIFENLGWEVKRDEPLWIGGHRNSFRHDLVLSHDAVVKGYIEVYSSDNLKEKVKYIDVVLNIIKDTNLFLIVTNGFAYDLYVGDGFFGCLTVPPTPEEIELLVGGANNA